MTVLSVYSAPAVLLLVLPSLAKSNVSVAGPD